eukprot:CAMPEP_0170149646 /NCGR_PEP_ID=MMETSP0033_2-20121228/43677_1 /TAXON_ID=195969 /ORGANISM="Dolichomastix tenuilepis, Strain CCMP3274" /LENGTH=169 /DNA_ID=CAMNT_0010386619 /DNA_START=73 /DNA_END=579 /DNA_ORIENTATION=+
MPKVARKSVVIDGQQVQISGALKPNLLMLKSLKDLVEGAKRIAKLTEDKEDDATAKRLVGMNGLALMFKPLNDTVPAVKKWRLAQKVYEEFEIHAQTCVKEKAEAREHLLQAEEALRAYDAANPTHADATSEPEEHEPSDDESEPEEEGAEPEVEEEADDSESDEEADE